MGIQYTSWYLYAQKSYVPNLTAPVGLETVGLVDDVHAGVLK